MSALPATNPHPARGTHPSLEDVHRTVSVRHKNWWRRLLAFSGPAYMVAVGYMDPGNWATDIAGGAQFGYALIWVLLMSNLMALLLQTLSVRLGVIAGKDLAQACRAEYPSSFLRYYLWILCEIAIIACDLAEVLGTIIGLKLLFGMPYIWGCAVTAADTLLLLVLQRYGIRKMEAFILTLVMTVGGCFVLEIFLAEPSWTGVVQGFVPSLPSGALYVAIGIIGATVMPHNLYLHSALVQTRAVAKNGDEKRLAVRFNFIDTAIALNAAFFVNSAILVMAAAVFFTRGIEVTEIEQAHALLGDIFGPGIAPIAFGLALLAAGQSSTLTATLAGQIVMEGFVNIRLRPWVRRLITRALALLPAVGFILLSDEARLMDLLILSQVVLSMQLPFAIVPLIHVTSDPKKMGSFVNPLWVKIAAWITATIIIGLNLNLVAEIVTQWIRESANPVITGSIALPVVALTLGVLAWITFRPWLRGTKEWSEGGPTKAAAVLAGVKTHAITHIGVALEHGPADTDVIGRAVTLARAENAKLALVHVVDTVPAQVSGEATGDSHSHEDEAYLEEIAVELRAMGLQVEVYLRYGDAARELVKFVESEKIDLFVMGAHGHRTVQDILLGSTVTPVRHAVKIPVMVVRKG